MYVSLDLAKKKGLMGSFSSFPLSTYYNLHDSKILF